MIKSLLKNKLFMFFLIFPFFNPTVLKFIPGCVLLYNFIQVWKLVSILTILIFYVIQGKVSNICFAISLYVLVSIFTSVLNGIFTEDLITNSLVVLGMAFLADIALRNSFDMFFKTLYKIVGFLGVINFLLCIQYPNGIAFATLYTSTANPHYFLSIDNGMFRALIPVLFCSCYDLIHYTKFRFGAITMISFRSLVPVLLIIMIGITLFIVDSAAGIISYLLFVVMMFLFNLVAKKRCSYKICLLCYSIFFIVVIVLGSSSPIVADIAGLFGRSATFTGRDVLWQRAIEQIMRSPIIGYGNVSNTIEIWGGNYSSHNIILEMALNGGILLVAAFVYIVVHSCINAHKLDIKIYNLFFIIIFAALINGLMETGIPPFMFALFVMASQNDILVKKRAAVTAKKQAFALK